MYIYIIFMPLQEINLGKFLSIWELCWEKKRKCSFSKGAKPMLTLIIYGYIEMNVKLGLAPVVLSTEIMSKSHLFLLSDVMHVHAFQ